jgi:hypothetical protein
VSCGFVSMFYVRLSSSVFFFFWRVSLYYCFVITLSRLFLSCDCHVIPRCSCLTFCRHLLPSQDTGCTQEVLKVVLSFLVVVLSCGCFIWSSRCLVAVLSCGCLVIGLQLSCLLLTCLATSCFVFLFSCRLVLS